MTKKKDLVKKALEHPELYSEDELSYFQIWWKARTERKTRKKSHRRALLEWLFNR